MSSCFVNLPANPAYITINIGDGTAAIAAGTTGFSAPIPFAGRVIGWTISEISAATPDSTISVDIWRDSRVNYPPTAADKISGTEPPSLTAAKTNVNSNLLTWDAGFEREDCIGFTVTSTNGQARRIAIVLYMTRIW